MATDTVDLCIVGAGPAALALAAAARRRDLRVLLVAPRPHAPWRATYGMWEWQWNRVCAWLPALGQVPIGRTLRPALIAPTRGADTVHRRMSGSYVVVDTASLQRALWDSAFGLVTATAALTTQQLCSPVTLPGCARHTRIIDARGARPLLTAAAPRTSRAVRASAAARAVPSQAAFGVLLDAADLVAYLGEDHGVLMDWRVIRGVCGPPSFLYVVRLPHGRVLAEETQLVGAPTIPLPVLRERLARRLAPYGTDIDAAIDAGAATENVHFPLLPAPRPAGLECFGAAGDAGHPATGYSVAASLMAADRAAAAIAAGRPLPMRSPPGTAAVHRWGMRTLRLLDPDSLADVFAGFAGLGGGRQQTFLEAASGPGETLAAMVNMWWHTAPQTRLAMLGAALRR